MYRIRLFLIAVLAIFQVSCSQQQIQATLDGYELRCTEVNTLNGVYTKLSGVLFNIDVVALQNNVVTTLDSQITNRQATLDFVQTTDPAVCQSGAAGVDPAVSFTTASSLSTTGRQTINNLSVSNAYPAVMCRVTVVYNGNTYRKCGPLTFAARPSNFTLVSTNATADGSGTNATTTDNSKWFKASTSAPGTGTSFNLTATATNAVGTRLTTYSGTPTIKSTSLVKHTGGVVAGALNSLSLGAASAGIAASNFSYSEVGYFKVAAGGVQDTTYTALDQSGGRCVANSSSNVKDATGRVGCQVASQADSVFFGRFIPSAFVVSPVSYASVCTATSGTTNTPYYGNEFSTTFNIRAVNDGLNTTQNYSGSYAKFATGAIGTTYSNYQFQSVALTNPSSSATLTQGSAAPVFVSSWASGQATVRATHRMSRPANPTSPQTVIVRALPTDTEATSPASYLTTDSSKVADTSSGGSPLSFRYGRLRLYNAYGAETMPLSYAVTAQYWNGTRWATNTVDSCTQLSANMFKMRFPVSTKNNLTACDTSVSVQSAGKFSGGVVNLRFSAPGNSRHGWMYVSLKQNPLDTTASTCVGGSSVSTVVTNQAQFGSANTEEALVSFGQYKSKLIYTGEQ